jgi:AraC-like DNA-binding protein
MSKVRQPEKAIRIRTFAVTLGSGTIIPPHSDEWDQLIYASRGVMSVHTDTGSWVVPCHRAVWVPSRMHYSVEMSGTVSMRTLYIAARLARALPRTTCCTVNVPPLLRELILHSVRLAPLYRTIPTHKHLISVIVDQLEALPTIPLQLSSPADPRAVRIAAMLRENPGDERPLEKLARSAGASPRTVERLFRSETSMSFGKWRQRLRILHSLRLLAEGEPVTAVALEMGYQSPSAFISMFRNELGTTPGAYFDRR